MSFSYNWTLVNSPALINELNSGYNIRSLLVSQYGQYQWIATLYSVWYSTNYGISWNKSNAQTIITPYITTWLSSTKNGKTVIIGTLTYNYIARSNNYGITWSLDTNNFFSLVGYVANTFVTATSGSDARYLTIASNTNGNIYTSSNYGVTYAFRQNLTYAPRLLKMSSSGQYQYVTTFNAAASSYRLWFSSNYGITWTIIYTNTVEITALSISLDGKYVLITSYGTSEAKLSGNYGTSFNVIFTSFACYYCTMSTDAKYIILTDNTIDNTANVRMAYSNDYGNTFNTSVNFPQSPYYIAMSSTGSYALAGGAYNNVGGIRVYRSDMRSTIACLLEGTLVKTPTGYVPIETLKEGDMIRTYDSDIPITKVGKWVCDIQKDSGNLSKKMYKIPAGELRTNKDTYISHYHRILVVDFSHPKNPLLFRLPKKIGLKEAEPDEFTKNGKYTIYHLQIKEGQFFVVNGDCCVEAWKANAKFF